MNRTCALKLFIIGSFLIGTISHTYSMFENYSFDSLLNAFFNAPTLVREYTTAQVSVDYKDPAHDYAQLRAQPENMKRHFPSIPATNPISWHHVLGVDAKASDHDINRAYKKLSLKTHPDKGGNSTAFHIINQAKKEGLGESNDLYTVLYQKIKHMIYENIWGLRSEVTTSEIPVKMPPLKLSDVLDEHDKQTISQLNSLIKKCRQTEIGQSITLALLVSGIVLHECRKKADENAWINRNWLAKKIDACSHAIAQRYPRLSKAAPWILTGAPLCAFARWSWNAFDSLHRLGKAQSKVVITPVINGEGETPYDLRIFQKNMGSDPMGYMTKQETDKQFEPVRRAESRAKFETLCRSMGGLGLMLILCGVIDGQTNTPDKPVEMFAPAARKDKKVVIQ